MGQSHLLLLALVVMVVLLPEVQAFGAGNVPSFSFLEHKAFRHGDIEDVLTQIVKKTGGLLGRGSKFGGMDIKRIYFGNWLRDYSQAMDVAGLTKLSKQAILNLVMGLGFLAHGYATREFEVTEERLGVYLPVEHIDSPEGYNEGKDARQVDPRLRGPVEAIELEIDPRTGMKNYIANEQGHWPTSAQFVRRKIVDCISLGRRARSTGSDDETYEAYRILGTLLHTLEDFTAHSNWCELSLRRMGHQNVFSHVGDGATIRTSNGQAPPLVTGTFGGADFLHSLLGETTDKLSESSVSDLTVAMDNSKTESGGAVESLGKMFAKLPGGGGDLTREMQGIEDIGTNARNNTRAGGPEMSPQELHATLWKVLMFRDNVMRTIEATIEKIPGLSTLVENLTNSINKFVFTTLEPILRPLTISASSLLFDGSAEVLKNSDQFAVFEKPNATNPSHSFLAKDHFNNVLNEPAGKVAREVVREVVELIVAAWENESTDPNRVASTALEAFHHPYFYNPSSKIQKAMATAMATWFAESDQSYTLNALTKASVRQHNNVRRGAPQGSGDGCGQRDAPPTHWGGQGGQGGSTQGREQSRPTSGSYQSSHNAPPQQQFQQQQYQEPSYAPQHQQQQNFAPPQHQQQQNYAPQHQQEQNYSQQFAPPPGPPQQYQPPLDAQGWQQMPREPRYDRYGNELFDNPQQQNRY